MDNETPVCFWRGKVRDFVNENPDNQWITLKADRAIGKVENDYEAGMIQMRMSVFNKGPTTRQYPDGEKSINFLEKPSWKTKPPKRLTTKTIRMFLFQCADIPSADSDGTSDCFISVWNPDGLEKRTTVVEDTLNPIYFSTIEISYDMALKGKQTTIE